MNPNPYIALMNITFRIALILALSGSLNGCFSADSVSQTASAPAAPLPSASEVAALPSAEEPMNQDSSSFEPPSDTGPASEAATGNFHDYQNASQEHLGVEYAKNNATVTLTSEDGTQIQLKRQISKAGKSGKLRVYEASGVQWKTEGASAALTRDARTTAYQETHD